MNKITFTLTDKHEHVWPFTGDHRIYTCVFKPPQPNEVYEINFSPKNIEKIYVFLGNQVVGYWHHQTSKFHPMFYIPTMDEDTAIVSVVRFAESIEEAKKCIYNNGKRI